VNVPQARQEESRADQQHRRQRNLATNERSQKAESFARAGRATGVDQRTEVAPGGHNRRHDRREESGHHRDGQHEGQHASIHDGATVGLRQKERAQRRPAPPRDDQRADRAEGREA
jgi:hypothetical protein